MIEDEDADAVAPLISHGEDGRDGHGEGEEEIEVDESSLSSPGAFIWGLTLCAGVSGLLFGYDTGVISSTLVSINLDLSSRPLTTLDKSLITSCTSFFALLASPLTGFLADAYGRKTIILGADVLFVVGALVQAWTTTVGGIITGRSIVGVAVGSASFVVPLYISEVAPSPFRGRLVVVSTLFITGGQVVAYVIGWLFSDMLHGWRWMVGLGALPAAVQFCLLFFLPESPRHLVKKGEVLIARKVLTRIYAVGEQHGGLVEAVLKRVEREISEEEEAAGLRRAPGMTKTGLRVKIENIKDTFTQLVVVEGNRRALVIACMLQGLQQLCGFNSLMYFSATIFHMLSFSSPTLTSLLIALTNFLFTLVAFATIDRIGRRRILLLSLPIMVLGLAICAYAFCFLDLTDNLKPNHNSSLPAPSPTSPYPMIILTAMILYVSAYALGIGTVPWQQSELFPLSVRAVGSGIATATNWACNTVVGLSFLPMMLGLGPQVTFAMYAVVCAVGWVTVWRIYPETRGMRLEDVGGLLAGRQRASERGR